MSVPDNADAAVRAAIASQGKQILQAALVEAKAGEAADDKNKGLAAKVQRMKEDITRETVARSSAMRDREERAALASAVAALNRGDTDHALKVIQSRLAKLQRRIELRGEDSDDDSEDGDEKEVEKCAPACASNGKDGGKEPASSDVVVPSVQERAGGMTREQWLEASGGCLSIRGAGEGDLTLSAMDNNERGADEKMRALRAELDKCGFVVSGETQGCVGGRAERLMRGLNALRAAGLPAFFVWMYDEAWEVIRMMWQRAEAIMGQECVLEPTVAAYHLDYKAASAGNRYVGTNFSLPHRDYTYSDTFDAQGRPQLLTVWVPVCDVTVDNGCMYVVPKEFDDNFDRDDVSQHMLVQSSGWLAGKSFLSFPLAGARPLAPAPAGTMMAWWGNVIHWGSQCHQSSASSPRASIACVFRRKDAPVDPDTPPISFANAERLTQGQRLDVVVKSMDFFKHWSTPWDKANKDSKAATCKG